ncbi:hypothetical protein GCM10023092_24110 [Rurimicrobium arvi]|uniref:Outer membrane protein beta-barrel domain-containing protein n=2 Tax=Rurimicrobium arvi TaxID=2049916 RepID=A0ABP8MWP8_9BACT
MTYLSLMKRIAAGLILFFCAASDLHAQETYFNKADYERKVFFGSIVLGMNAAQIDGDTYSGFHKAGLNMGVGAYTRLSPKWLANIELLYSQKGARQINVYESPAVGTIPLGYRARLNYVEIPLTIQYLVYPKLHLGGGLSYSRLISDKEEIDSYTAYTTQTTEGTFRKQDINYLVSLQYQLYDNLFARVRYQYSMLSIRDGSRIPVDFHSGSQFNNLFAFHLICVF